MKITLIGAAGNIGFRIANNLAKQKQYEVMYVENSPAGIEKLKNVNLTVTPFDEAVSTADIIVMAVADRAIPIVGKQMLPLVKKGGMIMMLDPAAAYAGQLPMRDDISYFVTHPCHQPFINDETDLEAKKDYFGGHLAKQNIVCAIHQGGDAEYQRGEDAAKVVFAPVIKAYRVTLEQMAILEPALVETVCATLLTGLRAAMDRAVEMGVPAEAAKAFLVGHLLGEAVVVFDYVDYKMSVACQNAVKLATPEIFQPDWLDKVFDLKAIKKSTEDIIQ